jgi:hypothetical protein
LKSGWLRHRDLKGEGDKIGLLINCIIMNTFKI